MSEKVNKQMVRQSCTLVEVKGDGAESIVAENTKIEDAMLLILFLKDKQLRLMVDYVDYVVEYSGRGADIVSRINNIGG